MLWNCGQTGTNLMSGAKSTYSSCIIGLIRSMGRCHKMHLNEALVSLGVVLLA